MLFFRERVGSLGRGIGFIGVVLGVFRVVFRGKVGCMIMNFF